MLACFEFVKPVQNQLNLMGNRLKLYGLVWFFNQSGWAFKIGYGLVVDLVTVNHTFCTPLVLSPFNSWGWGRILFVLTCVKQLFER